MKLLLLSGTGALIGGLPGALVAFSVAAGTDMGGWKAEAICFTLNLLLALCGAFVGMLLSTSLRGQTKIQFADIVIPLFLGTACGLGGYLWLYWAISHANPPL
jgi:hypothetical protein